MSLKPIPKKKGKKDLAKSQIPLLNKSSLGSSQIFGAPPFGRNYNMGLLKHPSKIPSQRSAQMASEQNCGGLEIPSSFRISPTTVT